MPEAPIPSRWIGNAPTDRIRVPSTGRKSVDLRHVIERPPQRDAEEEHVQEAQMVGDQQHATRLRHVLPAGRPPSQQHDGQRRAQHLDEPIPGEPHRPIGPAPRPGRRPAPASAHAGIRDSWSPDEDEVGPPTAGIGSLTWRPPPDRPPEIRRVRRSILGSMSSASRREDLLDAPARRVDDDRVGGRLHRRDRSRGVAGVALADVAEDRLEADAVAVALRPIIGQPATGPFLVGGGEVILAEGVGEDQRPLVAPLGDDVVIAGEFPLPFRQDAPDRRAVRDDIGRPRSPRRSGSHA